MNDFANLVGIPYKDGGTTPDEGLDCWGLARLCVRMETGVTLPEKPLAWRHYGCLLGKDAKIRRGDILFMVADWPNPIHMGIAISQTEFIHAWRQAGQVVCEPIDRRRYALLNVGRVNADNSHDLRN